MNANFYITKEAWIMHESNKLWKETILVKCQNSSTDLLEDGLEDNYKVKL